MSLPLSAGGGVYCSTMVRNLSLVSRRRRQVVLIMFTIQHGDAVKLVFERFFRDDGADRGFHGLYAGGAFVFVDHGHFAEHCLGPKGAEFDVALVVGFNGGFKDPHAPGIDDIHTVAFAVFGKYYFAGFEFSNNFRIIPHCVFPSPYNGKCPKQAHHQYIIVARRIVQQFFNNDKSAQEWYFYLTHMNPEKTRWGIVPFFGSILFIGLSIFFSARFPPRFNSYLYQSVLPGAGILLSALAFFLGHFSYPRVHNLKVYLLGYLTGFSGLGYFLFRLLPMPGPLPHTPMGFMVALYLLIFINILSVRARSVFR